MIDAYTLTIALGGRWSGHAGTACCPAHDDRTPSLSIAEVANGRLLLHCHAGCSYQDILAALRGRGLIAGTFRPISKVLQAERRAAERAYAARSSRQAARIWVESLPIGNSLGERYLRARGITCAIPNTIHYLERCWHQSARRLPALVSQVRILQANVPREVACAVHRTYLAPDGRGKADVSPVKAMLGPTLGGAVHLSGGPGPLVVTEGIETGLSLLSGLLSGPARVWAALSAGGMGRLIVAPDGDPVGGAAAETLAARAHALGWQVSMLPAPEGFDWNDVLTGKAVPA